MTLDLVSLKFLVVSGSEPFLNLWREGARLSSIPVECVGSTCLDAPAELGKGGFDVMIVDNTILPERRDMVLNAARQCDPRPHTVLAVAADADSPGGVDVVVRAPADLNAVRSLIERLIRSRLPSRVLVVDDSGTMRSIVRKVLAASRYIMDVGEASNGHEAITEIKNGAFAVVILDYHMPGLNGLEILRAIRKTDPDIGVVMMTTTVDDGIAQTAIAEGAVGFLKKPFYPADIDQLLDRFFEGSRGV